MSNLLKKISAIPRKGFAKNTYRGSLADYNMTRFPGTFNTIFPHRDADGSYRTGLDPNASYIKQIGNETERNQEIQRVTDYRDRAQAFFGDLNLGSRSDFYLKMTDDLSGTYERCPIAKLKDGDNIFNLNKPEDLLMYAYLRVHPNIAPSLAAVDSGGYTHSNYYVNDDEHESEVSSKKKRSINKAIGILDTLTTEKMKRIGRQLGLPFTDDTTENTVYNSLDNFIKESDKKGASQNADMFVKFCEMKDENLAIQDIVKQAILYGVLRKDKEGKIFRGKNHFAADESNAVVYLTASENIDDLNSIEEELKIKKMKAK